jgi:hypothetical protein
MKRTLRAGFKTYPCSAFSVDLRNARISRRTILGHDPQLHIACPLRDGNHKNAGLREFLMTSKNMIFTLLAIGAMSTSANAQMSNSMGSMSKPGMKATTSHTTMTPKSDAMMDKKSDAMEDKKMMHSSRHHRHMHHHHRMMHHKM